MPPKKTTTKSSKGGSASGGKKPAAKKPVAKKKTATKKPAAKKTTKKKSDAVKIPVKIIKGHVSIKSCRGCDHVPIPTGRLVIYLSALALSLSAALLMQSGYQFPDLTDVASTFSITVENSHELK